MRMRDRSRKWESGFPGARIGLARLFVRVATAKFQLPRPTQPGQSLALRVALIRDWRKLIVCEDGTGSKADEGERWKADLAPDQQQFWDQEWHATPAPPGPTIPKLIPAVTTAAEPGRVDVPQT